MLTPNERANYVLYGRLPPRVEYTNNNQGLIVPGTGANYNNELSGQGYKIVPRWRYLLDKFVPTFNPSNLIQNGLNYFPMDLIGFFGGGDNDGDVDDKSDNNINDKNAEDSIMKEVLTSDITKSAIKTGISLLPGGAAALATMEAGSKVAEATNLASKIPKTKKL